MEIKELLNKMAFKFNSFLYEYGFNPSSFILGKEYYFLYKNHYIEYNNLYPAKYGLDNLEFCNCHVYGVNFGSSIIELIPYYDDLYRITTNQFSLFENEVLSMLDSGKTKQEIFKIVEKVWAERLVSL
jgi:hypothetical protein